MLARVGRKGWCCYRVEYRCQASVLTIGWSEMWVLVLCRVLDAKLVCWPVWVKKVGAVMV
ncbi:hypothetical protein DPMN_107060 [Dreissena polymorpha]|uniref:Uncharacterized protein n=1 Tax=Dreissena polymorpha TaxID=45954 RepID=A0A9D4QJS8_DREPO|nr:hypothetical protein DPMN_107060 [Dreissena polymorpha]